MRLDFEWDPRKAVANFVKHEITFEEAATVFGDPLGRILADPRHSFGEERSVLLGISDRGRMMAVMYVDRGKAIRIISARKATYRERRNYEESTDKG